MIGRLRGTLVTKHLDRVVLDVGGVGYEVAVTVRALVELPSVGEEIVLHTHLHVREDALVLFGFASERDQEMFRVLLSAPGVGPKVALAMLSTMSAEDLHNAIASENVDALTVVPGIGSRSAQKIILELKPKLGDATVVGVATADRSLVRDALEGLGYSPSEIRQVMSDLPADQSVEEQIRLALRSLGAGRG